MLIGHYAPALILQRARPSLKLWQLFVAVQFVDILWGLFELAGIEHIRIVPGFTQSNDLDLWDIPFSHSLVATAFWSLFAFLVWRWLAPSATRTGDALVIAAAVASHFVADLIVHVPDLPLMDGQGVKMGFGLWRQRALALTLETSLFAAASLCWWWPERSKPGSRASGAALLLLTALAAASYYIPTPPTPAAMALTGLTTYALSAWLAHWIEQRAADPT